MPWIHGDARAVPCHEEAQVDHIDTLRPVRRGPDHGTGSGDLSARFRHGPVFLEQVDLLARYGLTR
jgi:hypothetical protein